MKILNIFLRSVKIRIVMKQKLYCIIIAGMSSYVLAEVDTYEIPQTPDQRNVIIFTLERLITCLFKR